MYVSIHVIYKYMHNNNDKNASENNQNRSKI